MTERLPEAANRATHKRLPQWDWFLLPAVFFATAILLAGGSELISRLIFTESPTGAERCMVLNDATTGARAIPNSVCYDKNLEAPVIEYKFNSCGHRAGMECGPKPTGVYRIVMIGSSVAMGDHVQQRETFAGLLPEALSQKAERRVEVYNESMGWGFTHSVSLRFKDAITANPDLIVWILTPGDVDRASVVLVTPEEFGQWKSKSLPVRMWLRVHAIFARQSATTALAEAYGRSRTAMMVRRFLYRSGSLYVKAALTGNDSLAGFSREPLSAHWEGQLKQVDSDAATMEAQARDAGIPFVAAYVPNRVETTMVSMGQWPTGIDPYQLDNRLRSVIESHGGTYIDLLPEFREISDPGRYYFPVDGHPNPEGHAALTRLMAKQLTSGVVPALSISSTRLQ